jgi:hypothetical protein
MTSNVDGFSPKIIGQILTVHHGLSHFLDYLILSSNHSILLRSHWGITLA